MRGLQVESWMYNNYTIEEVREAAEEKLFTVFSTFSGGGGSSTGYKLAGGDVRGVLEFQRVGMDTYLKNYPGTPNFCEDIRKVTGQQVLDKLNMKAGDLDIFDGSHRALLFLCLVLNVKVGIKPKQFMDLSKQI